MGNIKQSDFALLILVVAVSLVVSYFAGNAIINSPKNRKTEVEVVEPISSDFPVPSSKVFVKDFINPTELIKIGESTNEKPFSEAE